MYLGLKTAITIRIIAGIPMKIIAVPLNAIIGPSIAEKQRFMVNNNGTLTMIPHSPPSIITEITRATDTIAVRITATGRIHLIQKSSFAGSNL